VTRRITLVVAGAVAVALLLAGVGTVLLAGRDERADTRDRLEEQATDGAALVAFFGNRTPEALPALRRSLSVDGVEIVRLDLGLADHLPPDVVVTAGDVARLRAGEPVSMVAGDDVVAIAVVPRRTPAQVVVVTTQVPLLDRALTRWVAVASLAALLVAAAVGTWLARRIARPVREVEQAARRVAAGDLTATVTVPDSGDEVAQLARSVNDMTEALARAKDLERTFLLSISHDLRTPLTSIRGYAEGLDDGTLTDVGKASAVILQETSRLERLVSDLLELARLDARAFSLHPVTADVGEIVEVACDAFRPAFQAEGVALDVDVAAPLPAVVDPDRLGQVVGNLVENALKHARGTVTVRAVAADGSVLVTIADDGAGIDPGDEGRVFERLYTGQRPARRQVGSGLGLAIVAELVLAMGGEVRAEPRPGGGAAFVVALPERQTSPRSS
jgi:two-component system sensor histidine kinase BaeS